jgi:hypothetical protein
VTAGATYDAIVSDGAGGVWVVGETTNVLDCDVGGAAAQTASGAADVFAVHYDAGNGLAACMLIGGSAGTDERAFGAATGPDGGVAVGFTTVAVTYTYEPLPAVTTTDTMGGLDLVVLELNADGTPTAMLSMTTNNALPVDGLALTATMCSAAGLQMFLCTDTRGTGTDAAYALLMRHDRGLAVPAMGTYGYIDKGTSLLRLGRQPAPAVPPYFKIDVRTASVIGPYSLPILSAAIAQGPATSAYTDRMVNQESA